MSKNKNKTGNHNNWRALNSLNPTDQLLSALQYDPNAPSPSTTTTAITSSSSSPSLSPSLSLYSSPYNTFESDSIPAHPSSSNHPSTTIQTGTQAMSQSFQPVINNNQDHPHHVANTGGLDGFDNIPTPMNRPGSTGSAFTSFERYLNNNPFEASQPQTPSSSSYSAGPPPSSIDPTNYNNNNNVVGSDPIITTPSSSFLIGSPFTPSSDSSLMLPSSTPSFQISSSSSPSSSTQLSYPRFFPNQSSKVQTHHHHRHQQQQQHLHHSQHQHQRRQDQHQHHHHQTPSYFSSSLMMNTTNSNNNTNIVNGPPQVGHGGDDTTPTPSSSPYNTFESIYIPSPRSNPSMPQTMTTTIIGQGRGERKRLGSSSNSSSDNSSQVAPIATDTTLAPQTAAASSSSSPSSGDGMWNQSRFNQQQQMMTMMMRSGSNDYVGSSSNNDDDGGDATITAGGDNSSNTNNSALLRHRHHAGLTPNAFGDDDKPENDLYMNFSPGPGPGVGPDGVPIAMRAASEGEGGGFGGFGNRGGGRYSLNHPTVGVGRGGFGRRPEGKGRGGGQGHLDRDVYRHETSNVGRIGSEAELLEWLKMMSPSSGGTTTLQQPPHLDELNPFGLNPAVVGGRGRPITEGFISRDELLRMENAGMTRRPRGMEQFRGPRPDRDHHQSQKSLTKNMDLDSIEDDEGLNTIDESNMKTNDMKAIGNLSAQINSGPGSVTHPLTSPTGLAHSQRSPNLRGSSSRRAHNSPGARGRNLPPGNNSRGGGGEGTTTTKSRSKEDVEYLERRKAQNREAQKTLREKKNRHVHDLEERKKQLEEEQVETQAIIQSLREQNQALLSQDPFFARRPSDGHFYEEMPITTELFDDYDHQGASPYGLNTIAPGFSEFAIPKEENQ